MTKPLPVHTRRLAQLVNRPGGLTVNEAVAAAETSLAGLRSRGELDTAATIAQMQALAIGLEPRADELYRMSNSLIGIGGVFGWHAISDVAQSLCTLIERLRLNRHWDENAIKLHVDSLRLLSQNAIPADQVTTIGHALRQVVDRVQPGKPAGPAT